MKKRIVCLTLLLALVLGSLPAVGAFEDFSDVEGHWAVDYLRQAYADGILEGYDDGTMRPDTAITGAQMVTVLCRVLNAQQEADLSAVLSPELWYYSAAAKAVALELISVEQAASLDAPMTRHAAFNMLAEAFQLGRSAADQTVLEDFSDAGGLTGRERAVWASMIQAGYVNGWDGTLMLESNVRRAEFIALLYRVAGRYLPAGDYVPGEGGAVLSGDLSLQGAFGENLWTDCSGTAVRLNGPQGGSLTLRSQALSTVSMANLQLDTLVLASWGAGVSLGGGSRVGTLVVGTGSGNVSASCTLDTLDLQGSGRTVSLNSRAETVYIAGDNNTVTLNGSQGRVVITGSGNTVTCSGAVEILELGGKHNTVGGYGRADKAVISSVTNTLNLTVTELDDQRDYGITGASAAITGLPELLPPGEALTATVEFTDLPAGKAAQAVWYVDGAEVSRTDFITGEAVPGLSYTFKYTQDMALTATVGFAVEYTTAEGEAQRVTAPDAAVALENYDQEWYDKYSEEAVLKKVTTGYKGNYTTQWAIDNDYTDEEKTIFVNAKGYSSDTQYLIWASIATQHINIFEGSQGNWTLIRSGLMASGAAGTPTPVGVWKTTYKQTGWYTASYTVAPVVRFKGGGYAMHSRLYYPGTHTLSDPSIGFPVSHGCLRLYDEDIQWIYDNVPTNTTVVVF